MVTRIRGRWSPDRISINDSEAMQDTRTGVTQMFPLEFLRTYGVDRDSVPYRDHDRFLPASHNDIAADTSPLASIEQTSVAEHNDQGQSSGFTLQQAPRVSVAKAHESTIPGLATQVNNFNVMACSR
jgi:hypothetical protein